MIYRTLPDTSGHFRTLSVIIIVIIIIGPTVYVSSEAPRCPCEDIVVLAKTQSGVSEGTYCGSTTMVHGFATRTMSSPCEDTSWRFRRHILVGPLPWYMVGWVAAARLRVGRAAATHPAERERGARERDREERGTENTRGNPKQRTQG